MKTRIKQLIILCFIISVIAILYLTYKTTQRTLYNDPSVVGNTAGNLYNGGLFCEYDGMIYFSNDRDNGALYSMDLSFDKMAKLNDDKPYYLNVDDNYIYYARANYTQKKESLSIFNFFSYGLYRIDKNGKNMRMLSKQITDSIALAGNYIYFQVYDKKIGLDLYRVKIDGEELSFVSAVNIQPFSIREGTLYFSPDSNSDDHYIRTFDLETDTESVLYEGRCYMPIAYSKGIYYISLDDKYNICHINYDGSQKTVVVNEFCSFYNISYDERYLFYQIDGGEDNRIAMLDLYTMTQTTIMDGNFKNIHIIDNYVFFRDFNEENTYVYDIVYETLNLFKPPVIK